MTTPVAQLALELLLQTTPKIIQNENEKVIAESSSKNYALSALCVRQSLDIYYQLPCTYALGCTHIITPFYHPFGPYITHMRLYKLSLFLSNEKSSIHLWVLVYS